MEDIEYIPEKKRSKKSLGLFLHGSQKPMVVIQHFLLCYYYRRDGLYQLQYLIF